MENFYYFTGLYVLWVELLWVVNPARELREKEEITSIAKIDIKERTKEQNLKLLGLIPKFYVLGFIMLGIFTNQWAIYLVYLLSVLIVILPISMLLKSYYKPRLIFAWIDSVIYVAFTLFVIINHFHLKIDVYNLLKTWIY